MSDEQIEKPKRRRKPQRPQDGVVESVQQEPNDLKPQGQLPPLKKKKKRKKKRQADNATAPSEPLGIEAELGDELTEDIVQRDPTWKVANSKGQGTMKSESTDKIFIERKSGFQTTTKTKLEKKERINIINNTESIQPENRENTMDFALSTQKVIKVFSTYCIGLLGGVSLWHIMSSFIMYDDLSNDEFLKGYTRLASPGQSFYYLLFTICTVSVCDRFDLGRPTSACLLTYKSGTFAIIVYLVGLVISLSMSAIEQKMSLWDSKKDVWSSEKDRDDDLSLWLKLNTARGVMAIIGWFFISFQPETDRLSDNLMIANEDIMNDMKMPTFEKTNETFGVTNRAFSSMA